VLKKLSALEIDVLPVANLQLLTVSGGGDRDTGAIQPVQVVSSQRGINDVKGALSPFEPLRDERQQQLVLFFAVLKENAYVVVRPIVEPASRAAGGVCVIAAFPFNVRSPTPSLRLRASRSSAATAPDGTNLNPGTRQP
jgi:hypothetical protein